MKPLLRPATPDEAILRQLPQTKSRDIPVNPEGGFFEAKTVAAALRRAAPGDVVLLPNGEFPGFEIRKSIIVRAADGCSPVVKGTIKILAANSVVAGIHVRSESGQPGITVAQGAHVLKDCTVQGGIFIRTARMLVRNCLVRGTDEGILVTEKGALELSRSRVEACRIGVAVRDGAECRVYASQIEGCRSQDEADPGAGIYAEQSSVHCEGVTLSRNGVGAYLQQCAETRFVGTSFHANDTAALISSGGAQSLVHLWSCAAAAQTSGRCAQFAVEGGAVEIAHTTIHAAPPSALSLGDARAELQDIRLASSEEAALDLRAGQLSGSGVSCQADSAEGLLATGCQGTLKAGVFVGAPPVRLTDSPQLLLESCSLHDIRDGAPPVQGGFSAGASIDLVLDVMRKRIGQHGALAEIERILRLAHAARQRRTEGLPVAQENFHCVFMGPRGCGKLAVARKLAEGLHALGVVGQPTVTEASLLPGAALPNGDGKHGVIFVRARQATGSAGDFENAKSALEKLVSEPGDVVILEGDREDIRRILRSSAVLERAFRHTLFFNTYGPAELAALFAEHCSRDHIVPSPEARQALLLMFHIYSDRKDKRFATEEGVDLLYEWARRKYLERSSFCNRIDLPLEPRDLEAPQDRALRNAIEKSPEFVSFCPSCRKENPWVAGLESQTTCVHCEAGYVAEWGIWKESAAYRRMHDALAHVIETGAITRRAKLPLR
ncbi:MAG TPA: right-handed parallel beta-helix repeat-containing protein [Terrimicrobiaceae bacterium]|nr:right-handed parallel beta-helix repeat-containing protein [Terrimicrobiaceae bacterium]